MSDPTSWVNTVKLQGMFSSNRSISVESMKPRQTITQIILQMNMYVYYIYSVTLAALRLHLPFLQQQIWTSTPLVLSEQTCIRIAHLSPFRPNESHLCRSGFGRKR